MQEKTEGNGSLPVRKIFQEAILPTRAHPQDAGLDLYAIADALLEPGQGRVVQTGIAVAIPDGNVGLIADRSSMAKRGVLTAGGVIDAGCRGEIGVILWNVSREEVRLARGERIAQLLVVPILAPAVREAKAPGTRSCL